MYILISEYIALIHQWGFNEYNQTDTVIYRIEAHCAIARHDLIIGSDRSDS